MKNKKLNWQSICFDCAIKNGAKWPNGHVATSWYAICDVCNEEKSLCDVPDWNWPKNIKVDLSNGREF